MKRNPTVIPWMCDPHVVSLTYRIERAETVDFDKAPPLRVECEAFRITLDAYKAKVEMIEHFAVVEDARKVVDPFLRTWELSVDVINHDHRFRFVYEDREIIDRNSAGKPGFSLVAITGNIVDAPVVHVSRDKWPDPPQDLELSPDVDVCGTGGKDAGRGKNCCSRRLIGHSHCLSWLLDWRRP